MGLAGAEDFAAVPGEVLGVGAEVGAGVEAEALAVAIGEAVVVAAGQDAFGEFGLGDLDAEVVSDGPESGIKVLVCNKAKGSASY